MLVLFPQMSTSSPVLRPWWLRAAWWQLFKVFTWKAKMPLCPPRISPTSCRRSFAVTRYANTPCPKSIFEYGARHWLLLMSAAWWCLLSVDSVIAGLLAGMSGADRVSAGVQPAAGSAAQRHNRNQTRGRGRGPVLHPDRRQRHQHLKWLTSASHDDLMIEGKLSTEGSDGWAGEGVPHLNLASPPPPSSRRAAIMADTSFTCLLSHTAAKTEQSAPCLPRSKSQVTFPASVPSHPGLRNEHYRDVPEREKDTEYWWPARAGVEATQQTF